MPGSEWWRGAVFYQIYPRSFMDTNKDGIGDLKGIADKLDYIAGLGVDAIWISPFFKSPMKDYGYDVSDYCDIDPMFGTLADFRALLDKAHRLGLKIVVDMVLSHSSDQHPWFTESRQSRDNPKADWYVWADPKPDGSPPNNWQSFFGGPAWDYDVRRGQYYLHNFLKEQPDLNLYNPGVRKAVLDACRFWLDFGVDGFRLDAVMCYCHDPALKDNPPNPNPKPAQFNIDFPTPHTMQLHEHDFIIPEALKMAEDICALLDLYPGRMAVAELGGDDGIALAAQFTAGPRRLQTAYNFSLLSGNKLTAGFLRDAIMAFESQPGGGWPSWAFSNHDVVRAMTRWKNTAETDGRFARMLVALLCSLKGTPFLYQGDELGLPEAQIPYDRIQDPWGKYLYPLWQGRDGCRTPMPWSGGRMAGFTKARTSWLPIPDSHKALNAAAQARDDSSTLNFTRYFLHWRRTQPALATGEIRFTETGRDDVLAFTRTLPGNGQEAVVCTFNLSGRQVVLNGDMLEPFEARFSAGGQVVFSSVL